MKKWILLPGKKKAEMFACIFVFISIISALLSNYYDSKVMGDANLGVGIWAGAEDSNLMKNKRCLRKLSDGFFYSGIVFSVLGLFTQAYVIFSED